MPHKIPNDWESKKLGDIADFINGRAFKPSDWETTGLPIIRIQNLNGSLDFNYYAKSVVSRYYVNSGDLLFSWSGSRGTSFGPFLWSNRKGILNQHIFRVVVNNGIDKLFLYHQLKRITEMIEMRAHGSAGLVHVTKNELTKFSIDLPRYINEQIEIARILTIWDQAIKTLDKLIDAKARFKKCLMQKLLTGAKRLPGFNDKWQLRKVGEIAEVKDGTHQTPKYVTRGIPFYSVENVTSNNFIDTKYISEEEHNFLTKSFRIEKGDILMTRIGSIGDCKLIDWDVNASFYVSLALLKIKSNASSDFIFHYSKGDFFKRQAEARSLRWAVPKKINLGEISEIKIFIPSTVEEQTAIANILTTADFEIDCLKRKLALFTVQKQGLTQKLLTGKVRINT
jgi:type I restriction enzyme S subunit